MENQDVDALTVEAKEPKILKFKVSSFRKIPNPFAKYGTDFSEEKKPEMYVLICDVTDIPNDIPMDTNPRDQKLTTGVARTIEGSLVGNDGSTPDHEFYLLNRGMLLSAKSVIYDNIGNVVTVLFEDWSVHGDVDGGHTYEIIKKNQDKIEPGTQFVKIEILTGVEDFFANLAAARNFSNPVNQSSIDELNKLFSIIHDEFDDAPYGDDIRYKQFGPERVNVDDLVAILTMFDIDRYPVNGFGMGDMPVLAYSAKSRCRDYFVDCAKRKEKDPSWENPFEHMRPIMRQIVDLYEYVEANIGEFYNPDNNGKQYGRTKGVSGEKGKHEKRSRFYNNEIDYNSPNGFIYPIVGAFRALVRKDEHGDYYFCKNPIDILKKSAGTSSVANVLVENVLSVSREKGPNATGKAASLWAQLFQIVFFAATIS